MSTPCRFFNFYVARLKSKIHEKILLASTKTLTNSVNPSSNLLQMLCSGNFDHQKADRNPPVFDPEISYDA
jgi:hypothetical protein